MRWLFLVSLIPAILWAEEAAPTPSAIDYKVHFLGLDDPAALKTIKGASFLTTLKKKKPISINALRFRAESDIPDILKALHAHGYYEGTAQVQVAAEGDDVEVFVMIQPGPVYTIGSLETSVTSKGVVLNCQSMAPEALGISLHSPAEAVKIIDAEQKALLLLSECGYPLAHILDRRIVADYQTKTVSVYFSIEAGLLSRFGPTSVTGAPHIKRKLFKNKTAWKQGDLYDARLVETTQKKLLDTGLFSSVVISHDQTGEKLPMRIEALETKHKRINIGASYQTFFGPGLTFGWENRNVSGLGRTLSLQGDITARTHTGTATFFVPDWWKIDQDYVFQGQALQESVFAYHERSYSLTQRVERRIETKYRVSLGLRLERLIVSNSVRDGTFTLLESPLYFRFSSANHLLNPTKGATLTFKTVPSINFSKINRYYLYNSVIYAFYLPVSHFLVIANQVMGDLICSSGLSAVPVPKRVLGGSDEDLRGYRYKTVSPRDGHKPIGGRFGLFYTFESRFRLSQTIGLVPFFDLGLVELSSFPKWDEKWYKSVGMGFRYFTFLGPIRLDVAFPLDRRRKIDSHYRILVSIGQTF